MRFLTRAGLSLFFGGGLGLWLPMGLLHATAAAFELFINAGAGFASETVFIFVLLAVDVSLELVETAIQRNSTNRLNS